MQIDSYYFSPKVDSSIQSWIRLQEHRSPHKYAPRYTITISRAYGCEAYVVAKHLREILKERTKCEWAIFDKKRIEDLSMKEHLAKVELGTIGDDTHYWDFMAPIIPNYKTHGDKYNILVDEILKIAKEGNAIVIGRGASIITHRLKNCYNFRLEANFDFRVRSIARRAKLSFQAAEKAVKKHHESREIFLEEFLNAKISDRKYYEMIFNNERMSSLEISKVIADYVFMGMHLSEFPLKKRADDIQRERHEQGISI